MEKVKDIFDSLDENKVVAIESEKKQYFFGTKKECKNNNVDFLNFNVKDTQDINGILCVTI